PHRRLRDEIDLRAAPARDPRPGTRPRVPLHADGGSAARRWDAARDADCDRPRRRTDQRAAPVPPDRGFAVSSPEAPWRVVMLRRTLGPSIMSADVQAQHPLPRRPTVSDSVPDAERMPDVLVPEAPRELLVRAAHRIVATDRQNDVLLS